MKKLLVLAISMVAFSSAASAQFMNSGSTASSSRSVTVSSAEIPDAFSYLSVSYISPTMFSSYDGDTDEEKMDGSFGATYEKTKKISSTYPLYLSYGLGISYLKEKDTDDGVTTKMSFLSGKIPVNILYALTLSGTKFSILPYAGLNAYYHLSGKETVSYKGESESFNLFDSKDSDSELNRFNMSWTIGAKVIYNNYFFGIGYESPVIYLYNEDDVKIGIKHVAFSIGMSF